MFHRPHFNIALAQQRVPAHLLYAMCALSARHSRRPAVRGANASAAGGPFARAAHAALFDAGGRLRVPADTDAVRALVLLEMADFVSHTGTSVQGGAYTRAPVCIALALEIARRLARAPGPATLERECLRRAVWLCYVLALTGYLVLGREESQLRRTGIDTRMRLPLDETRFELAEGTALDMIAAGARAPSAAERWLTRAQSICTSPHPRRRTRASSGTGSGSRRSRSTSRPDWPRPRPARRARSTRRSRAPRPSSPYVRARAARARVADGGTGVGGVAA
jgi:hypothetical protein